MKQSREVTRKKADGVVGSGERSVCVKVKVKELR